LSEQIHTPISRQLNIAIVSNYFAPHQGGAEGQNRLIGEALVRRGHRVTVLTRRYDSRLPACESLAGMEVRRLRPFGHSVWAKWFMNLSTAWQLIKARPGFDLVLVTQMSPHALGPAFASYLRRLPIVLRPIEHGEMSGEVSSRMLARARLGRELIRMVLDHSRRWAYRRSTSLIIISNGLAQEARESGMPPDTLVSIPNAVDTTRFRPPAAGERVSLRHALGLQADAEVVVWTGRLVRRKGLETLAEAWADVGRKRPKALLLILGTGPGAFHPNDAEAALRSTIAARGLQASIMMTGAVQAVERYLQAADLFVFTSEQEGFGNALVEAMACGLSVVTSRIDGAAELVRDGHEGLKFAVGDAGQLCRCITSLLDDPDARRRMGAAARRSVERALTVERVAGKYEQLFRSVAGP
jgi:glycosyltransferase involved in cell wall biosynthesis